MSSLSARLLISVSVLLIFFFGVTIVVLDTAFRTAGEQAQQDTARDNASVCVTVGKHACGDGKQCIGQQVGAEKVAHSHIIGCEPEPQFIEKGNRGESLCVVKHEQRAENRNTQPFTHGDTSY